MTKINNKLKLTEKLQKKVSFTIVQSIEEFAEHKVITLKEIEEYRGNIESLLSMLSAEAKKETLTSMIKRYDSRINLTSFNEFLAREKQVENFNDYGPKFSTPLFIFLYLNNKALFSKYIQENKDNIDFKEFCYMREDSIVTKNLLDFILAEAEENLWGENIESLIYPLTIQDLRKIPFLAETELKKIVCEEEHYIVGFDYYSKKEKLYNKIFNQKYPLIGSEILLSLLEMGAEKSFSLSKIKNYKNAYLDIFTEKQKIDLTNLFAKEIVNILLMNEYNFIRAKSQEELLDMVESKKRECLEVLNLFSYQSPQENQKVLLKHIKAISLEDWISIIPGNLSFSSNIIGEMLKIMPEMSAENKKGKTLKI